jgi:hypothetical protein
VLPSDDFDRVGTPDKRYFEAQWPARAHPCERFAAPSRVANASLGAIAIR